MCCSFADNLQRLQGFLILFLLEPDKYTVIAKVCESRADTTATGNPGLLG